MGSTKNGGGGSVSGARRVPNWYNPPWDIYDTFPKCHNSNHNIHDLTMVLHWALHGPSNKDLSRFYKAMFIFSKKIHSLNPLNVMKHVNGHCCTLPRLREPSWTFILHGHPNGPINGPCKAYFRGPLVKRALHFPYMVQIDDISLDNRQT